MNRKPILDIFRLLLAFEVVREHYTRGVTDVPAVALFLGISGFVIPGSWIASRNWGHFLWKRVLRLVPAFSISLGLVAIAGGAAGVLAVLGCYLTLGLRTPQFNGAVWSLGWEEIFYAALAVLFLLGGFKKPVILGLALIGTTLPFLLLPESPRILMAARPLMVAFFTGNLCYLYREKLAAFRFTAVIGLVTLCAWYGLAAHGLTRFGQTPSIGLGVGVMTFCLLAVGSGFTPKLPKFPDISYGIYLYHIPFALLFGVHSVLEVSALIGFALLSSLLVEQPALSLREFRLKRPKQPTLQEVPEPA